MSDVSFRWLHLSDLHFGMKGQAPLWANLKHHFYDDLPLLHRQSGPWDLLIFSGDIVQKGDAEEFKGATAALVELYGKLTDLDCSPKFMAVPGNHDLVRPSASDMSAMLLQDWSKKHNVRDDFLNNPTGPYRETIRSAFANYQAWYEALGAVGISVVDAAHGFLPGDQVVRFAKDERQLGLIGLNSTWLQLSKENKAGDLHVDHQQLSVILPDAEGWCRANDFNLLVTHQPAEWLTPGSLDTWKKEIAPPGRFDLHLFGHMHEPLSSSLSQMGSSPVAIFQSPSLFGLEHFGDGRTQRIHGYSAGALVINEKGRQLRIWPRTYQATRSGQGRVTPNFEFILPDNESTVTQLPDKQVIKSAAAGVVSSVSAVAQAAREEAFVATAWTEKTNLLSRFGHHLLPPGPHAFVRKEEQDIAANALTKRALWIIADWGLGSDEFVSSVLQMHEMSDWPVFRFDLSEMSAGSDLAQEVEVRLGFKIQQISDELATGEAAVLLLDDLVLGERVQGTMPREAELEALSQAILDYCPGIAILLRTSSDPANSQFGKVKIGALDEPDLKAYIANSPEGGIELAAQDAVAKLLLITGGVPDQVDQALKALQVVTLSELVASHQETGENEPSSGSQGLRRAIEDLGAATQPMLQRALQMLQALATFPHGAQFEHIKRFNGVNGFYPTNATELRHRALIVTSTLPGLEQQSQAEIRRILTVPRTVRDVVRGQMSEELLNQHNRRAAELYFGSNWRAGSTSWPPDRKYSSPKCSHHEIANASAILLRLLKTALRAGDMEEIIALMHLSAAFADALNSGSHYYGASEFSSSFLHTAPADVADDMVARVRLNYGQALRLTGERSRAIHILEELDPSQFDRSDRESLWLSLALAHGGDPKAKEYAEKLLKATKDNSYKLQARSIIIQSEPASPERTAKLVRLQLEARKKKSHIVANNLALQLASESDDKGVADRYLNEVLSPKKDSDDIYNLARAAVSLAEQVLEGGEALSNADHSRLIAAYQYLFIQRIPSLFDRCHRALWKSFARRREMNNLFALFRNSSFIWRIRGVGEKEEQYISSLASIAKEDNSAIPENRDGSYFKARLHSTASAPLAIEG
ncbi:hypothetical protein X753_13740 [Mesorhizobium sp. LNJC399B00]|uniref:metallophosphoesterase n=1 Tax=unclassified Mesorhizobium TaxID=325217 RepID=UPI0003CF0725|nr:MULTISPECIES: metallophosphoesterase [unclassified Mesorhizobium]ESY06829.1 hypothetical protein X753_13740 [Mesorhizobium sp. LNJC399B00]WJI67556.1 metallophosphoesterase [Mesorhizobium sp. C399B]